MRVVDNHFHVPVLRRNNGHAADFRRAQCVRREHNWIVRKLDDIDLLPAQFADDRLHAHALHADTSADAVHVAIAAGNGDFRALTRLARASFNDYGVVVNFRDFLFEEALHELRIGARKHHAGVLPRLVNTLDDAARTIAYAEILQARLFSLREPRFGLAHVKNQVLTLNALHRAVHELTHSRGIFHEDGVPLCLAHLLQNYLLGRLRRDAAERFGLFRYAHFTADFGIRIDGDRLGQRHLMQWVGDFINHTLHRRNPHYPTLGIDIRNQIFRGAEVLPRGHQHGVFHRIQHNLLVDALFLTQYFD